MDHKGQIAKTLVDNGNDGSVERSIIYTRDANGNTVKTENDLGNNGSIESNIQYVLYPNGYSKERHVDSDNDGKDNDIYYYDRNVYGNLNYSLDDIGANGTINKRVDYTYNSHNKIATQKETEYAEDGSVTTVRTQDITYNSLDLISTIDRTTNGTPSYKEERFYDPQNRFNEIDTTTYATGEKLIRLYEYGDTMWSDRYDKMTEIKGSDKTATPTSIITYDFDSTGAYAVKYEDLLATRGKGVDNITIQSTAPDNYILDFTGLSQARLDYVGMTNSVRNISSIGGTVKHSTIILDKEILSKIADPTSAVYGKSGDTVELKNSSDFTKLATSSAKGYDQYTYKDSDTGATQNLYIDSDISVVLG